MSSAGTTRRLSSTTALLSPRTASRLRSDASGSSARACWPPANAPFQSAASSAAFSRLQPRIATLRRSSRRRPRSCLLSREPWRTALDCARHTRHSQREDGRRKWRLAADGRLRQGARQVRRREAERGHRVPSLSLLWHLDRRRSPRDNVAPLRSGSCLRQRSAQKSQHAAERRDRDAVGGARQARHEERELARVVEPQPDERDVVGRREHEHMGDRVDEDALARLDEPHADSRTSSVRLGLSLGTATATATRPESRCSRLKPSSRTTTPPASSRAAVCPT